jgi:ribokinase
MLYDTISVGSATLDLFLKSSQFRVHKNDGETSDLLLPYGAKIDVEDFAIQSGGGATNTAVGFARMGLRSAVVAEIGKDLGAKSIIEELKEEKVETRFLVQEADERTAVSALLVSSEGGRSAVTARGAASMLTLSDVPIEKLRSNWMHLSSIGNVELLRALAKHCKQQHIRFSWNPGASELKSIEKGELHIHDIYPTVFCVNKEESEKIINAGYEIEKAGEIVIITNGREGGRYYENKNWTSYAPSVSKAVQETGAGDAFVSGVVAAYLYERRTKEAIEWGKKNAASVVQHMGAKTGLLRASDFGLS